MYVHMNYRVLYPFWIWMCSTYFESLFLEKCARKNHKSLLLLGTKIEMARDISIHPWIKTWVGGLLLSKPEEGGVDAEWALPLVPTDDVTPEPGGDLVAPSHVNNCVAFIKNDWNGKMDLNQSKIRTIILYHKILRYLSLVYTSVEN